MDEFEFVVIGGGSAGYAGARTAAAAGLRTAVIDGGAELGGLCILRGCMPSKTLLESSHRYRVLRRASEFGLEANDIGFNARAIIERKRRLVGEFADFRRGQLEDGRFELIRGKAEFLDAHTVRILLREGGMRDVRAKTFLLSTGSVVATPAVPGLSDPEVWTSDDILDSESLPESLTVLGGGPVALEMATYCQALGVRVVLVQRSSQVLKGSDPDAAAALVDGLRHGGMEIILDTKLKRVARSAEGWETVIEHAGAEVKIVSAKILNALGRRASLEGLDQAGIEIRNGRVATAPDQRTSQNHIFAAGDVCGPLEVVHVAIQQGEIAARNAARLLRWAGETPETIDYRLRLFAVFSDPQFATVGATESELRESGIPFRSASYPFADHGKSLVMGETEGFVKLIVHADSREILGGTVVGPCASELIHEIVVAMRFRGTAADLATTPHYHPTLSEIWTYPAEELIDAGASLH
ncbi:MAG: dihydrolipoyl dehydrogenase family protein [Terrimicrobiaceae bacterium]